MDDTKQGRRSRAREQIVQISKQLLGVQYISVSGGLVIPFIKFA